MQRKTVCNIILTVVFGFIYEAGTQSIVNTTFVRRSAVEGSPDHSIIVLPCNTTGAAGKIMVWEFQKVGTSGFSTIFFNGGDGNIRDLNRHFLTKTADNAEHTLTIKDVNCNDTGEYRCSIRGIDAKQLKLDVGKFSGNDSVQCVSQAGSTICTVNDTKPNATLIVTRESNGKEVASNNVLDSLEDVTCESESFPNAPVAFHPDTTDTYILAVKLGDIQVYSQRFPFTVESTTTAESTTGGPVPNTTPDGGNGADGENGGLPDGAKIGLGVAGGVVAIGLIVALIIYLVKKPGSGNVPYEFEIDGVKEDKTIEISPGILIRLAATCYGAKPPASIQWCISYNGKDPVDMTEKDYGNSDALNTSVTTNKRDPKTSDTHSKLEMVPNEDHDGAVIHCVAITKISADEEKWDLKTSPKITLKLKKGQVGDYPGQGGYYQGQGGDYRHQGGDYRGQDGYHQGQGGDNHGQGGNYHRHVGQAGQEYQPHGNTRNDKDPFPQPGKRPNALEPIQGQRTLTPIGDIEKTSFKKKRQTNKQTSEL